MAAHVTHQSQVDARLREAYMLAVAEDDGWPCFAPPEQVLTVVDAQRVADDMRRRLGFDDFAIRIQELEDQGWQIITWLGDEMAPAMTRTEWEMWLEGFTRPLVYGLAAEMAG